MEKRKKKTGRIIALIVLFIVITATAAAGWYFFLRQEDISENTASILSTHVKTGSIQKTLSGTGTLAEQEAQNIAVQTGVKVTEYLVKNGQIVKAGDPVAAVNRASVMEAISSLREVMTEVSADMLTRYSPLP